MSGSSKATPKNGYNKLTEGLLEGVETRVGVDFFEDRSFWESQAEQIVFTGKIDEFFGYAHGKLEYRTVSFEQETLDTPNYQGNAVVNYTEREVPYTRVIEHKHFEMFGQEVYDCPKTVRKTSSSVAAWRNTSITTWRPSSSKCSTASLSDLDMGGECQAPASLTHQLAHAVPAAFPPPHFSALTAWETHISKLSDSHKQLGRFT